MPLGSVIARFGASVWPMSQLGSKCEVGRNWRHVCSVLKGGQIADIARLQRCAYFVAKVVGDFCERSLPDLAAGFFWGDHLLAFVMGGFDGQPL
jgi:hypothetical protein